MKTSGSKRDHIINGNYADERHKKNDIEFEDAGSRKYKVN